MEHPLASLVTGERAGRLERFRDADGFVGYRSPLLARLRVPHLFTTRLGGGRKELDLGQLTPRTIVRLRSAAGAVQERLVSVKQVHGARALHVSERPTRSLGEADALVTERDDLLLCIHVADCVPVLLASSDGRRVAAVHAGWRGLVAGVLPRALEVLAAEEVVAAIGPCISCERFEVGPEVAEAFARAGLAETIHERSHARAQIDLRAAAALQLRARGVELIDSTDRCTHRDVAEFYSYRRDVTHGSRGSTGRLGALIGVATMVEGAPPSGAGHRFPRSAGSMRS